VDIVASRGGQLLEWLSAYTFPAEERFHHKDVAAETARFFLDQLLRNGTTTALVFATAHKVSAEALFEEAKAAKAPVSLATIYNTLHQFTGAGLLREIAIDGPSAFFDTNATLHHHFLVEETGALIDIPDGDVSLAHLPAAPDGGEIARVDVVVRVRRGGGGPGR